MLKEKDKKPTTVSASRKVQIGLNSAAMREALVKNAADCNTLRQALLSDPPADLRQAYRATLQKLEADGTGMAVKLKSLTDESELPTV